ncbi:MAG: type II secretion system F family protein [Polyangiales bacterium]
MNPSAQTTLMGWMSVFLLAAGVASVIYITMTDPESLLAKLYNDYTKLLDGELRGLFIQDTTGKTIANWQIAISVVLVTIHVVTLEPVSFLALGVAVGPQLWLIDAKNKRQDKIEQQLDTFLTALANALKASPSLGDALGNTATLLRAPLKEELELTMKETQLGMPLDQAILNMGGRVGSRAFAGALTTVLIGRQTGGDLPRILETSASTLREMARLEGVVRTKTAEGKAQAWVLGVMPPILIGILNWIDPEWLTPLYVNFVGNILLLVAVIFWIASVVLARKILAVDI